MKKYFLFVVIFLSVPEGNGQEAHRVNMGDTVSEIVSKFFKLPGLKLYNGKMKEIKKLNPQIKNLNFIYPGDLLILTSGAKEVPIEKKPSKKLQKYYELSLDYGIEYIHIKQKSLVGDLESKGWVPNLISLSFFAALNNFGFDARIQTVYFDWETTNGISAGNFWLLRVYLGAKWKLLTLRFELNEEPLFKLLSATEVEGTYQATGWLLLGISQLNQHRPNRKTIWKYSVLVGIPLVTKARGLEEKLNNKFGLKINLEGSYNGKIAKWVNSELLWSLFLGLYYQKQEFGNTWQVHSGTNDLEIIKADVIGKFIFSF